VELCVGATSRLVAEEAAKLGVAQIIASRRQVNGAGGYTGMTQADLVKLVREYGAGATEVIRDHGGPYQNGNAEDDWQLELDDDVAAGFNGLHLDVSALTPRMQLPELRRLVKRYGTFDSLTLQVGGERDTQEHLWVLLAATLAEGVIPSHCVAALGGHVSADKQCGEMVAENIAQKITQAYNELGVRSVAHNTDFCERSKYAGAVNAMNVAPEFGVIEMDAWLRAVPYQVMNALLEAGYASHNWQRWFDAHAGTKFERARCGLRYIWAEERRHLEDTSWFPEAESYARQEVRDAIAAG
jgi:hypothetical protein